MTTFSKVRLTLLIIFLEGCASLPPFPEVWQCQYNGMPRAFYCVNTNTKAKLKIPADAPKMKAAQCISPDDFKAVEAWISTVKQIADTRCR